MSTTTIEDPAELALPLLNGWTVGTALEQLEKRNGWVRCTKPESTACAYRLDAHDPTSQACAVGAFLPDDFPDLEGLAYSGWIVASLKANGYADPAPYMPLPIGSNNQVSGMGRLQRLHDQESENWNRENVRAFLVRSARGLMAGQAVGL